MMAIVAWNDSAPTLNEVCVKYSKKPISPSIASGRCFASILTQDRLRILLMLKDPIWKHLNRFSISVTVKGFISHPLNLRLVFFAWPIPRRISIGLWGSWPMLLRRLRQPPSNDDDSQRNRAGLTVL